METMTDDFEEICYPPKLCSEVETEIKSPCCDRFKFATPVSSEIVANFVDKDGRIFKSHELKKQIFLGLTLMSLPWFSFTCCLKMHLP